MFCSFRLLTPVIAAAFIACASAASAEGYRVINMQRILDEAKAAKAATADLDRSGEEFKKFITAKENELRTRYKGIEENRSLLSPKDYEEKKNAFNKELGNIQEQIQNKRKQIQGVRNDALVQINKATVEIIAGMAEKEHFDVALSANQVLFYNKQLDLTDAVIKELDARLPKISLNQKQQ